MEKRKLVISGLVALTIFFIINNFVTMSAVRQENGTIEQKLSQNIGVKKTTEPKEPLTSAQKTKDKPSIKGPLEFPVVTQNFRILRLKHKVWGNKEMSKFILGRRYEEFIKKRTTDNLVQEVLPPKFEYIINNKTLCRSSETLQFLVAVYSSPKHFDERSAIRKTYGGQNILTGHHSRTVFLIGAVKDPKLQHKILNESKLYGDIVQANYIDSYHNLSFKGISLLQWIKENCNSPQYLVKVDDDLYLDVFQVVKALKVLDAVPRFIIGYPFPHSPILRKGFPKWNVKKHLFPADQYYPFYYQGWSYILPNAVFSDFYEAAMTTPVFHIDDVYMTGILAGQLSDMDFLQFIGMGPKGGFWPSLDKFASECSSTCIPTRFCKHMAQLTIEDRDLIEKGKLEKATGKLECERLLQEDKKKEEAEKAKKREEEKEKKAKELKAEEERKAKERKAGVEKKANEKKAEDEKKAEEKKAADEKIAKEKKAENERKAQEKQAEAERKAKENKPENEKKAQEKKGENKKKAKEKKAEDKKKVQEKKGEDEKKSKEKKS